MQTKWYVYGLSNLSLREIYFGVSKDHQERWVEHCKGNTKAVQHWDWQNHLIEPALLDTSDSQEEASRVAHDLEKMKIDGWGVIQTGGI